MSSQRPPVRRPAPRPPSRAVYRRRRLGVAATLVLLVVATVDLVNGDDDATDGPADTVQQVVAPATPEPTHEVRVGPVAGGRQQPSTPKPTAPPAPAPAEPEGACADSDVTVRPEVSSTAAGGRVVVTLALSTTRSEACTWTVGHEHLAYKITDAGGDVWTSSDCPDQVRSGSVVVRRDLVSTYRLAWNGRESSQDCPDSMPDADPGTYAVQAAAIGGEPSQVVRFRLIDPADVDTTPAGPTVAETEGASTERATSGSGAKSRKKKARASGR